MDSVWYYVRNGAQTGPVSFDDLKALAASGQLAGNDLVWQEGTADWVTARSVSGLFAGPPPVAPPAPPAGRDREPEPLPMDDHDDRHPGGPSPASEVFALAKEFLRRTAASNPASIATTPAEDERLGRAGITDPTARRFAVWRRAVLWVAVVPTSFAALFGLINAAASDNEGLSGFGVFVIYLEAFALFALPTAAVMGAVAYDRLAASARWVLLGATVSFGVPILVAFTPGAMLFDLPKGRSSSDEEVAAARGVLGVVMGIMFYLILLPSILSLLPAASRACIRVKTFIPQSLAPGWGLVASVPLFVLLTLATFVLLYQFAGNVLLILGLLLWIGAPMLYLTKFRLLTRPVTDRRDLTSLAQTQLAVLGMIALGVLLLIIYLFTAKFFGMTIMGFDEKKSLIRPWNLELHRKWIEYVGRSLFLTVLFSDVMMRMSLSIWREERAFAGTEAAGKFDQTMSALTSAVEPKQTPPVA